MRILTSYIVRGFLVTFAITLLVFLFVMALGNIFKVIDLFSRGVSGLLILRVFCYGMPFSLIFAIPMSVLAAIFLMFSRLASDREIIAMKASGISVWQVIQPPIVISVLLCLVCVYINCTLAPNSHYQRRLFLGQIGVETPLSLIDEGRFIRDFPGLTIYVGKKESAKMPDKTDGYKIGDIVIYRFGEQGVQQTIRAESGTITVNPTNRNLVHIALHQVRMDQVDEKTPDDLAHARQLTAGEYPLDVDMSQVLGKGIIYKKRADLTIMEILRSIRSSVRIVPDDLIDVDGFARFLRAADDPLTLRLSEDFSAPTRDMLDLYQGSEAGRKWLRSALILELNRVIDGPLLYRPELFAGVKLSRPALERLSQPLQGEALMLANRMLLEDAYPRFIARNLISDFNPENLDVHRMSLMVEANTRLALSLSCFAFVLLGAALGMRIHRKESSIGIAVALAMVFCFYFFIIVADSMVGVPQYQPHLIVWIPVVLAEAIGFFLIQRSN